VTVRGHDGLDSSIIDRKEEQEMNITRLRESLELALAADAEKEREAASRAERYLKICTIPNELQHHHHKFKEMLSDFGLVYDLNFQDMCMYWQFLETYNISLALPAEIWVSGRELLQRWQTAPRELADRILPFPIYLWNKKIGREKRINDEITPYTDILEFQSDPVSWFTDHVLPPDIWYSIPQYWWFKRPDIEFFEKLEHQKPTKGSSIIKNADLKISSAWLSLSEVKARWLGASMSKLTNLIIDGSLPLYGLNQEDGVHLINPATLVQGLLRKRGDDFLSMPVHRLPSYSLRDRLFKISDIRLYEKEHGSVLKPKKPKSRRVEDNPNFKRAIAYANSVKHKYHRIKMDDLAFVTHSVLTHGDRKFEDVLLEKKYAGARELKREMFTSKRKPKVSTIRGWFRKPSAFPKGKFAASDD
jgi:hypothetical protein